jgi:hypothetical protein
MRIIKLQNEKIKAILLKKKEVVEAGRKLSNKIEKEARNILNREMIINGIKIDKDICSGKYEEFEKFFSNENKSAINEIIKKELAKEIEELDKLSGFINKYNGEVSLLVDKERIDVGEFERLTNIELVKGVIEVNIEDAVEEYKKRYKEAMKKKS